MSSSNPVTHKAETERFRMEVLAGLRLPQKELPSKYFYDERGSILFDQITELDEYYVTRAEMNLMETHIGEISELLDEETLLIEYGSGSSLKTRILLSSVGALAGYVPIDISREHLNKAADNIREEYPHLNVYPVCADYTAFFELPKIDQTYEERMVYFPGSTIGNFDPRPAQQFLERIAQVCGTNGKLLIGIDLKKDPLLLHNAYNDHEGVTAAFNLNLLQHINNRLGANFDLSAFIHYAFYNPAKGRVEMHLVSQKAQTITIGDIDIPFSKSESIWTESSYKYNVDEFAQLAAMAGFSVDNFWYDENGWFGLACCTVQSSY